MDEVTVYESYERYETAWSILQFPFHKKFSLVYAPLSYTSKMARELLNFTKDNVVDRINNPPKTTLLAFSKDPFMWKDPFILWHSELICIERQQILQKSTREACAWFSEKGGDEEIRFWAKCTQSILAELNATIYTSSCTSSVALCNLLS